MAELTGSSSQGVLATTAVTIVPAPLSGFRMIRCCYVFNQSGQIVTVSLQKNNGMTSYIFHKQLMDIGDTLELGDGDAIILAPGETLEAFIDETVATYPSFLTSYGDK
jgi:hypothetical protein